jgi:hypothetical protein
MQMNGRDSSPAEEEQEQEQVMSEVHLGCPPGLSGPHISHFAISLPPTSYTDASEYDDEVASVDPTISVDQDGDLVLIRRNSQFLSLGLCVCELRCHFVLCE